jgi:DNA-binding NtrC family response regulator
MRAAIGSKSIVPVLVASERREDHEQVRGALEKERWLVIEARDWAAALSLSRSLVFPVIVCDRDFQGPAGHTAVRHLARGWRTASVILLADQWDPELWEGLLQDGGFDVLMRPLHRDDVSAVLETAYRQWADGRPSKAVASEPSCSTLARSNTAS